MQAAVRGVISSSKTPTLRSLLPKCALDRTCNASPGSNIWWRGNAVSASALSDNPKSQSRKKRISKDERRALVEDFVNQYRASNAGKFPTASVTQQHVGGSFYVAKQIISELEYRCKAAPVSKTPVSSSENSGVVSDLRDNTNEKPSLRSNTKVRYASLEDTSKGEAEHLKGVLSDTRDDAAQILSVNEATSKQFEAKETWSGREAVIKISNDVHKSSSKRPITSSRASIQEELSADQVVNIEVHASSVHEKESNKIDKNVSKGQQDVHGLKLEIDQQRLQEGYNLRDTHLNVSQKEEQGDSSQNTSSVWGNLRSFASGIISFWKKM